MAKKKAAKPPIDPDAIENEHGLLPKQELFCNYYTMPGDFFGNATLAYAEAYNFTLDTLSQEPDDQDSGDDTDELYPEAKRIVLEDSQASTSVLQRKLGIGYARAAKLVDELEERGIIGPADGATPRKVIGADEGLDLQTYEALEDDEIETQYEPQGHGGTLIRNRKYNSPYLRAYNVCSVLAHRLLRNVKVQNRCRVMRLAYMKDDVVDSERIKVILQDEDKKAKLSGITSYDKLKGRIIDKTQDVSRLPYGQSDLGAVIATLPQERQDYFYGVIKQLIDEATAVRGSGSQVEGGGTR
jgi:hypothetical protein